MSSDSPNLTDPSTGMAAATRDPSATTMVSAVQVLHLPVRRRSSTASLRSTGFSTFADIPPSPSPVRPNSMGMLTKSSRDMSMLDNSEPLPPPTISLPPTPLEMEEHYAREACSSTEGPLPTGIPKRIPTIPRRSSSFTSAPSPLRRVSYASLPYGAPTPPPRNVKRPSSDRLKAEPPKFLASADSDSKTIPREVSIPDLRKGLAHLVANMDQDDLRKELTVFVAAMTKRRDMILETARLQVVADNLAAGLASMGDHQWEEVLRPMRRFSAVEVEEVKAPTRAGKLMDNIAVAINEVNQEERAKQRRENNYDTDHDESDHNQSNSSNGPHHSVRDGRPNGRTSMASNGTFGETLVDKEANRQKFRSALHRMSSWKPNWMDFAWDEKEAKERKPKSFPTTTFPDDGEYDAVTPIAPLTPRRNASTSAALRRSVVFEDQNGMGTIGKRRTWLAQRRLSKLFADEPKETPKTCTGRARRSGGVKVSPPSNPQVSVWED